MTTGQRVGATMGSPAAHTAGLRDAGSSLAAATLGGIKLGIGVDVAVLVAVAILLATFLRARTGAP